MKTRQRRRTTLKIETLEDRTVPTIHFDFRYDDNQSTKDFFGTDRQPIYETRSVLELAGAILGSRLTDHLTPFHDSDVEIKFPEVTDHTLPVPELEAAADTIPVYVTATKLPTKDGSKTLAKGGPSFSLGTERGQPGSAWADGANDFAPNYGRLSIDPFVDWYTGLSAAGLPGSNKIDMLSTVMHELGHVLGVFSGPAAMKHTIDGPHNGSTSSIWELKDNKLKLRETPAISGTVVFTGAKLRALVGQNIPLDEAYGHFVDGALSTSGAEAAMAPTLGAGTRKLFTDIDWLALDDVGWDIAPAEEIVALRYFLDKNDNGKFDGNDSILDRSNQLVVYTGAGPIEDFNAELFVASQGVFSFALNGFTTDDIDMSPDLAWGEQAYKPRSYNLFHWTPSGDIEDVFIADVPFVRASSGLALVDPAPPIANDEPEVFGLVGEPDYDNQFGVRKSGSNLVLSANGKSTSKPQAGVSRVVARGLDGDDTLTVDLAGPNSLPADGIGYYGSGGTDRLRVRGTANNLTFARTTSGSGLVTADGRSISFEGVENVGLEVTAPFVTVAGAKFIAGSTLKVTQLLDVRSGGIATGYADVGAQVFVESGGIIGPGDPGTGFGVLRTKTLAMLSGAKFQPELGGTTVGTLYDQIDVRGSVGLGGSTLDLKLFGFAPTGGQKFTILANDGTDPINGTFANLPEGAAFTTGGHRFTITYNGGTGNDIVVTAVEATPTVGSLSASTSTITTAGNEIVRLTLNSISAGASGFEFWLDSNQNGKIDPATDQWLNRLGNGTTIPNSWQGVIGGVSAGTYTLFGRAVKNSVYSDSATATLTVTNAPPPDPRSVLFGLETRANAGTTGNQNSVRTAYDAAGNFRVFWQDNNNNTAYTSKYDANGNPQGGSVALPSAGTTYALHDVAMLADGYFVVVTTEGGQLRIRDYNANGSAAGTINSMLSSGNIRSGSARLSVVDRGTLSVVWEQGGYFDADIVLYRLVNFQVAPGGIVSGHVSTSPAVAMNGDGSGVAVWVLYNSFGSEQLMGRRFGPGLNGLGSPFVINGPTDDIEYQDAAADVAMLPDGGFAVIYESNSVASNYDILMRRFDAVGNAADAGPVLVNSYLAAWQKYPRVAATADGRLLVTWTSQTQDPAEATGDYGIYGQYFQADGARLGGSFRLNTYTSGSQATPHVAIRPRAAGNDQPDEVEAVVGWSGEGSGDASGIFFQRVRTNEGPTGATLSSAYITEGSSAGTALGQLQGIDENSHEAFTFTLIDGPGLDSNRFSVGVGNLLILNEVPNYATKPLYKIRVRARDAGGLTADQDLVVRVSHVTNLPTFDLNIQTLTDDDGDEYQIVFWGPGTIEVAQADADGDGRGPIDYLFVDGTDPERSSVDVIVTKRPGSDGHVSIGQIEMEAGLDWIIAPNSDLLHGLRSDDNTAPLHKLVLRDIKAGASIESESPDLTDVRSLTARVIENNVQIAWAAAIDLTAAAVESGNLTALAIRHLKTTGNPALRLDGDFGMNLNLVGPAVPMPTLGDVSIAADLVGATWTIDGAVGPVTVKRNIDLTDITVSDDANPFNGTPTVGSIASVTAGAIRRSVVTAADAIPKITAGSWSGGSLTADRVDQVKVTGDGNFNLTLRGQRLAAGAKVLGKLTVRGGISQSNWQLGGNVGSVSVGSFVNSRLWVGYYPVFPDANPVDGHGSYALDLFTLDSFKTTSRVASFSGSSIVVDRAGSVVLSSIATDAALAPYGIAIGHGYGLVRVRGKVVGRDQAPVTIDPFRVVML
jgi:hypothetical protein